MAKKISAPKDATQLPQERLGHEWEDTARFTLRGWAINASAALFWLDRYEKADELTEDLRASLRGAAKEVDTRVTVALHLANRGEIWEALYNAMLAGLAEGHLDAHPYSEKALREVRRLAQEVEQLAPDAAIGSRVRIGGEGRGRPRIPIADEVILNAWDTSVRDKPAIKSKDQRYEVVSRSLKDDNGNPVTPSKVRRAVEAREKKVCQK